MPYKFTYFTNVRTSWLGWNEEQSTEYPNTKEECNEYVLIVLSDPSITRAFYEDLTNGKITHIKPE